MRHENTRGAATLLALEISATATTTRSNHRSDRQYACKISEIGNNVLSFDMICGGSGKLALLRLKEPT